MKQRKLALIGAGAMALASLGMAATPQTTITPQQQTQRSHNEAVDKKIAPEKVDIQHRLHPSGSPMIGRGLSPKEYGQWLQGRGKQKWNK